MRIHRASSIVAALYLVTAVIAQQHAAAPPTEGRAGGVEKTDIIRPVSAHWLDIQVKSRSIMVDPAEPSELHEVMDDDAAPRGANSPDGKHIAFIDSDAQRVKEGHDFDLFVADADRFGDASLRRLTTDQVRPSHLVWLADGSAIAFLAQRSADDANEAVWFVDLKASSPPGRISDADAERAWQLSIVPDGRIAWVQLNTRKSKEQFSDLIVQPAPNQPGRAAEGNGRSVLLHDQHISSYAFSPDGKSLAWSGLGSMFIVNLDTNASREIPLHGIHRQLLNHTVYEFAWRPDGKVMAIRCGFLGGVARAFDADPNAPWPRMFADDKVFFVPVNWTPTPEALIIGEGDAFPSPTADDPMAEVSPPAGDQSKPWWVTGVPTPVNGIMWIDAANAQARMQPN